MNAAPKPDRVKICTINTPLSVNAFALLGQSLSDAFKKKGVTLYMEPGPQGQAVIVADRKELEGLR